MPAIPLAALGATCPTRVHVAALAFSSLASFKPPPTAYASTLLAEHVLLDGFLTAQEPLQVKSLDIAALPAPWQQQASGMPLPPFSLEYVKGMLRGVTALALLHTLWESGNVDERLKNLPAFTASLQCIFGPRGPLGRSLAALTGPRGPLGRSTFGRSG